MTNKEKITLLEGMLDVEEGSLNEEMELGDVDNWDSLAIISLIALLDENFGKTIPAGEIRKFKRVKDVLEQMN